MMSSRAWQSLRSTVRSRTTCSIQSTTSSTSGWSTGPSICSSHSISNSHFHQSASRLYSSSSSSSSKPESESTSSSFSRAATSPARRLKIPTAKAKASASRALREKVNVSSSSSKSTPNRTSNQNTSLNQSQSDAKANEPTSSAELPLNSSQVDGDGNVILTRPLLRDVVAYATSESYDFDSLIKSGRLPTGWVLLEDDEVIHVPAWPTPSSHSATSTPNVNAASTPSLNVGDAFIFRSGSYVTWGMEEEQSRRFRRNVILGREVLSNKASSQVEGNKYESIGDETMEYLIDFSQPTRIVGDVLVIGHAPILESEANSETNETQSSNSASSTTSSDQNPDDDWSPLLARLAFSQGLARSARLSVQESLLSSYLTAVSPIPAQLESFGKVPLGRKEVIRKLGTLLKQRQTISLGRDNFIDEPEVYWENWRIEKHYNNICQTLDIEDRFKSINEKLNQAENLLEILRALLTEASSHRMEVIIIALIALEATLALISHGWVPDPKSWEWLGYEKDSNQEPDSHSYSHSHSQTTRSPDISHLLSSENSSSSVSSNHGQRLV